MLRFFSGLRYRLVFLVMLAILPALGLALATGLERRQLATVRSQEDSLMLVRAAASSQNALIEGTKQLLVVLARLPQLRPVDPSGCNLFLTDLASQFPNYTSIIVARPDGAVFCSSIPLSAPVSLSDRSYFQQALQTKGFVVGGYIVDRISKKAVFPFSYPVIDNTGQVQAVVIATLDLGWFNQLASQIDLPDNSSLLVIDQSGVILSHYPDPQKWVGKLFPTAGIIRAILSRAREGTTETQGVDGVWRLYAFTPIGGEGIGRAYVSVGVPTAVAYADANRSLKENLIALGLVAVLALTAAWITGDLFILRQVNRLVTATHRLAAGDLGARSGIPAGHGEINQLASAFDGMAGKLEERERELRQAEARYRNLVEQIPAVTYISSLDEPPNTVYVSPQVEAILGFTPEEWINNPEFWEEQMHPEDCERVKLDLENSHANGNPYKTEYRFRKRNGKIIWLRDQAVVVKDQAGKPLFLQGLMLDISDRKLAEAELQNYAARLERSNHELQDFAYIASHDLQEPLRKIQAFGERLVGKYGQELSQEGRDYAEHMVNDAARMRSMINDLLAYSRVSTKAHPFAPVDLCSVVTDVLSDLQARIEETGGKVEVGDLPVIEGDALQLRQMFQNLIGNALKFHKAGIPPVIKVYGIIIPFPGLIHGEIAQISVADNGIGFDEKYLDRIFEPFQRLHGRGVYEGSGIGLAICRKIAERHGGRISAQSKPGEGAIFIFSVPVNTPIKKED